MNTELREQLLFMFRQMVDRVAVRYLEQFTDDSNYRSIEIVITGFLKFLYDNTSQHRLGK